MTRKKVILGLLRLSFFSTLIVMGAYFLNAWLLASNRLISPTDAMFIEGLLLLIFGILLLIGSGGINLWSVEASIISALAGALFGEGTMGPSEIMKRDRWKPQGFTKLALILIIAGVFMILVYFLVL